MPVRPSIRSLAKKLGLSPATVSEALRDSEKVSMATRERVRKAAAIEGYQPNQLVGRVMAEIRRSSGPGFRGTIACVSPTEPRDARQKSFHEQVLDGARTRAGQLGFTLAPLRLEEEGLSLKRLSEILQARGISGLFIMPFEGTQDWTDFEWQHFASVKMDYCVIRPTLHTVCPDHHMSVLRALERLLSLGYKRIGMCLSDYIDSRIHRKWSAPYGVFQQSQSLEERIPINYYNSLTKGEFLGWFNHYRPEVGISHEFRIVSWLNEAGVPVPEEAGFFNLNCIEHSTSCAGLDLLPSLLGATAVESIVAQLHRNERGVPLHPKTLMIESRWNSGPTLRERNLAPSAEPLKEVHTLQI